jgi:hypothetical protein
MQDDKKGKGACRRLKMAISLEEASRQQAFLVKAVTVVVAGAVARLTSRVEVVWDHHTFSTIPDWT